jgi:hypothetical protein
MLTAKAISLRATVIIARTVREAGESVKRENEGNLVLEALMIRSGLVGEVLAIHGQLAVKGGGDLDPGVRGDLILGADGAPTLGLSLGDTIAEAGAGEAILGVGQDHPIGPDLDEVGEQGIVIHMSPSRNEITQCWITSRSKTKYYPPNQT